MPTTSTLTRLALTVAMSAALASISFASHAQPGQDVSAPHKAEARQNKQDKQERNDERKESKQQQQQQHRLSQQQQQERIRQQKQLLAEYKQRIADQQDHWLFDCQHSFAYRDANYGFDGRTVRTMLRAAAIPVLPRFVPASGDD